MSSHLHENPGLFDDLVLPTLFDGGNMGASFFSLTRPQTREEQRVQEELFKQITTIEGLSDKSALVLVKRVDLQQKGIEAFAKAIGGTEIHKSEYQGTQYKQLLEEYCFISLQTLGKNFLGFENLFSTMMATEMQRTLYLPEEKKTFWQKYFG